MLKKLIFKETKNFHEATYENLKMECIAEYVCDFKNERYFKHNFDLTEDFEIIHIISLETLQALMKNNEKIKEYVDKACIYINPYHISAKGDKYKYVKITDIIDKYKKDLYFIFRKGDDYSYFSTDYGFFFFTKEEIGRLNSGRPFNILEIVYDRSAQCMDLSGEYNFLLQKARENDDDYQEAVKMLLNSDKKIIIINEYRTRKTFVDLKNYFDNLKLSKMFRLINDSDDFERGLFSTRTREVVIERI